MDFPILFSIIKLLGHCIYAATLIFISGRDSTISLPKKGDLIILYYEVSCLIRCLSRADVHAFYENHKLKTTTILKIICFCHLLKLFLKPRRQSRSRSDCSCGQTAPVGAV